ncbi:superoxide dismutase [Streptomyces sp. NPDC057854]|uniref:superoxide dismutase n=1 Tax=unclassified Streptomyces TaxID=2593676 RepID=UPI003681311C
MRVALRAARAGGALAVAVTLAATPSGPAEARTEPPAPAVARVVPTPSAGPPAVIALPDGFRPEGIAIGPGPYAFFGSTADGSVYRADLRTGRGALLSRGPGTPALGMKTDGYGRLFVAGGRGGDARVLDTRTGRTLASYRLADGPAFVNDVVLTGDAAVFTDSTNPVLYRLPLRGGRLPAAPVRIPITGDLTYGDGFNANGIAPTPDGRALLVVQSSTGDLFRVDADGRSRRVDLHGESLPNGDGLLLRGSTLYAVENGARNGDSALTVLRLNASGTEGRVLRRVRDDRFDTPTTVAAYGARLYLPNARFVSAPAPIPSTPYDAVAVRVPGAVPAGQEGGADASSVMPR